MAYFTQKASNVQEGFSKLEWAKRGRKLPQPSCPCHSAAVPDNGARVYAPRKRPMRNCKGRGGIA